MKRHASPMKEMTRGSGTAFAVNVNVPAYVVVKLDAVASDSILSPIG
jgi:hypothetical protein